MLIFLNPHADDFLATPILFKLLGRRPLRKYGFLFDSFIQNKQSINILIDQYSSSVIPWEIFKILPSWIQKLIMIIETKIWLQLNNNISRNINLLKEDQVTGNDIIFAFSYKTAVSGFERRVNILNRARSTIFHLSHYFINTSVKSNNLRKINNLYLSGDSDISENSYFSYFFSWYKKKFLVLPFSVNEKFLKKEFPKKVDSTIIVTGSYHDLSKERPKKFYSDFRSVTSKNSYHYVRSEFSKKKDKLSKDFLILTSSITPQKNNFLLTSFSKLIASRQKNYFSINIVEAYAQSKYAIVGEEISGFPSIGSFEAMASGAMLYGVEECYNGLGLIGNTHFVKYDGSFSECIDSIFNNKLSRFDKEKIAYSGWKYVVSNFNSSAMFSRWISTLNNIAKTKL